MTEFTQPEQALPLELQQPPALTDDEAAAVLRAQAEYADASVDTEGHQAFDREILGMTYDGMLVSKDSLTAERRQAATDTLDFDQMLDIEAGVLDVTQLPEATQHALAQPASVYRVGHVSQLLYADTLPEQRVSVLDSMQASSGMAFRGSGSTENTAFGIISHEPSEVGDTAIDRLPRLDDKIIYPIGADGKPYLPTDA